MKILITGAKGFVGKNIITALECIRDGKDRARVLNHLEDPADLEIVSYDLVCTICQTDSENDKQTLLRLSIWHRKISVLHLHVLICHILSPYIFQLMTPV